MRALLFVALASSACSSTADPVSCEEALSTLAACTSPEQAECADDGPAAQQLATGQCDAGPAGKADWFGNRVWGEQCTWNWQCQGDTRHSCNQGTCYLRADEGNACDRRDDKDCSEGMRCADDLAVPSAPAGLCQATRAPVVPALYAETLRRDEATEFQEHAADIMTIQIKNAVQKKNGDDKIRRTFHAKRHACVVGDFAVAAPSDLAVGPVFSQTKTFPAWVRFSNGTLTMGADSGSAIQGLAIKLMGVGGPKILEESANAITQDMLMVNIPANVVANANEFMEFTKSQDRGTAATAHYLLTHPRVAVRVAKVLINKPDSVRTTTYWAANAHKHGSIAVKYSAKPCAGTPAATTTTGDSYLRADLKPQLAAGTVCFDVFVQKQLDAVAQSIEDGTSVWTSPLIKVARLTIPRTALDTPATDAVEASCNELSFNPWNSAPEYRPLGHMNRSRKFAYEASKNMRHAAPEPTTIPGRTL